MANRGSPIVADVVDTQAAGARPSVTAGAKLKAAREAAGLTIDAVAHQLKLAPRQVIALEEDDWQRLPGRTFVRGFARNYARFVQLDPDAVLSLLPAADAAPALERPALAASPRPMGEIPAERAAKPSSARWLVPLVLLAIAAAVGYYELSRTSFHLPAFLASLTREKAASPAPAEATPSSAATPGASTSALPNPVTKATAPAATDTAGPAPASPPATSGITVLPTPPAADTAAAKDATPAPATPATEAPLVLTFKGTSWAEVKDAKGRVVLQMTGGAGMTQTVSAMPPLELSLGNAPEVAVTFRGQSLDLSAYTRGNVARVSLQ